MMPERRRWLCLFFLSATALIVLPFSGLAQEEDQKDPTAELPTLSRMLQNLPSAQELIDQVEPLDWIVLRKNAQGEYPVLISEAVPGRPNTLEDYRAKKIKKLDIITPLVGISEYSIPISAIDRIVYAEEQMLMRVDKLLENPTPEDIEVAFELLSIVENRIPNWDQTAPRLQKLLFQDALIKRQKKEPELALALLEECHEQNPDYPGVTEMVGEIVDELVSSAVGQENFRKAQHFLDRVGESFPNHPVRQRWLKQLKAMSDTHFQRARQLFDQKDYAGAAAEVQEGNRILRASGQNLGIYNEVLSRYQQVHVGVVSLGQKFPVTPTATTRQRRLREASLFEPQRADQVVYYDTDFFEKWEPLDLGRRVVFTLRPNQPHWTSIPPISSPNIIDTLQARLDKTSPAYDERFASYVKAYLVRSPQEFEVQFSRIPLRIESLFAFPVTNARGELYSERFFVADEDATSRTFRRRHPEPDGLGIGRYHAAEVIEHKFENSAHALQALQRGEVQMIAHLQPWEIDAFESNRRFYRRKYALPTVHVIQFNPDTEILQNTQVRRALSKAIDRERILRRTILRDPAKRHGRVVAAPWPSNSYANSSLVEPPTYDLIGLKTAAALRATAEMVLKTEEDEKNPGAEDSTKDDEDNRPKTRKLPKLRLILEEDPVTALAAPEILKFWQAAGFDVEIVPSTDDPTAWDMVYRKVRMLDPQTELWPFLTMSDKAEVTGLLPLPDWLKQSLVDLDFTANFPAAEANLRLLHRHLAAQAFFIPLWELDDYAVFSINMSGFADEPVTTYQDVAGWSVKPMPGG